jgi:fibronectin type 3 domain-containing protein
VIEVLQTCIIWYVIETTSFQSLRTYNFFSLAMNFTRKSRLQWLRCSLFCLLLLLCGLPGNPAAAEPEATEAACTQVTAHVTPALRTIIFNRVAILPLQADDPQLAAAFSQALYASLAQTGKYRLLPEATTADRLETTKAEKNVDPQQQAVLFGRTVKARGVVHGSLSLRREIPADTDTADTRLTVNITMTDAQTGKTAWSLTTTCTGDQYSRSISPVRARRIMDQGIEQLLRGMVAAGDIFSPLLPEPTVISTRGELRKIRVILQPDPPYTYTAYQLLASDSAGGVFTVHGPPAANDRAPIILEADQLQDGKKYFFTVIGLSETGLANIPAPPFSVTTSGAPEPLDTLQSSGNNLRSIRLFWPPSQDPNVTGYVVYRSTTKAGPFEKIADIDGREQQNYIDYGSGRHFNYGSLADDTQYFYTLRTKNKLGIESEPTAVVSARTKGTPLPPTEVRAIERQPRKIPLFWTPGQDPDIKGYAVLRSETGSEPFEQIDFIRGRETQQYTDAGSWSTPLKDNFTYFYQLRSINVLDMSSATSETVSATTKAAPAPIQGLEVTNNQFRLVDLHWQPNTENDIISYEIFRGETGDDLRRIATVDAPVIQYRDKDLRDGSTYWYQVRAVDSDKLKGPLGSPLTATTKPPPTAPKGLTIQRTDRGIELQWLKNPEKDIHHYEIYNMGFLATEVGETQGTTFMYTDTLDPGSVYRFQVRAVNDDGMTGSYSQPAVIRIPKPVVIE